MTGKPKPIDPVWVPDKKLFSRRGGIIYYEDPACPVANVCGRGETREAAFKHWIALTKPYRAAT